MDTVIFSDEEADVIKKVHNMDDMKFLPQKDDIVKLHQSETRKNIVARVTSVSHVFSLSGDIVTDQTIEIGVKEIYRNRG